MVIASFYSWPLTWTVVQGQCYWQVKARGVFWKLRGCHIGISKEVISLFIDALYQLIKTEESSCRTNLWSLWKYSHSPSGQLCWTLTLETREWMQSGKKIGEKLAFPSHGLQRILGSSFSSLKMITELLACSGLPWRPEVSFSPSHLCLWKVELICLSWWFC